MKRKKTSQKLRALQMQVSALPEAIAKLRMVIEA